jgi:CelD/BcsL family acetyltransferase involved in cellulose biosynthesis
MTIDDRHWTFEPALTGLERHRTAWDAANRKYFASHPLLDSRFVLPLVRFFGEDRTLLALLMNQDALEGAVLLQRRGFGVWQTFLPSQAQIAPALLSDRIGGLDMLMDEVPGPCWLLDFLNQDPDYSCFRDTTPQLADRLVHAQTVRVRLDGAFDTFWSARPKNLKKSMRRYFNRLEKDRIPLSLRAWRDPVHVEQALRRYGSMESSGWKGAAGTAVHGDNIQGRFYHDVLNAFAENGQAVVYEFYLGDQLAASRLCISSDQMLVILKTTYNEKLRAYAPGRLLLYKLLDSEFEAGRHHVIEFYTNATKETLEWANESRVLSHVSLYRNVLAKAGAGLFRRLKGVFRDRAPDERRLPETAEDEVRVEFVDRQPDRYLFEKITAFDRFLALEKEWTHCCELDGHRSFFLTHAWFENFIHEVTTAGQYAVYVATDKVFGVQAIFPMMWKSGSGKVTIGRTLTFLANYYSPIAKPIWGAPPESRLDLARSFVRYLLEVERSWDVLDLGLLPNESGDFEILKRALEAEHVTHIPYVASTNWFQPTDGLGGAAYAAALPSRIRSTIRRGWRRAERVGGVKCRLYREPEDVAKHIDDYYSVYAHSWKRPEPYPSFHRRLAKTLAMSKKCLLGVVYLEDRPVASQIWIVADRVASILKLAYDRDYKAYSFGSILTHRMIVFVIDELGVDEIDFLTGDDTYKKDWMSCRRERSGLLAFNTTVLGKLRAFDEVRLKPFMKRVVRNRASHVSAGERDSAEAN